ncbi:hypothetical protein MKX03_003791 [Papaver bracteatum]|nr:hypothetical protein MKX03_003791 [Papaver bracteatum]
MLFLSYFCTYRSAYFAPRTKVVNATTECRLGRHPEASSQDDGPGTSPSHPSSIGSKEIGTLGLNELCPSHSDVKDPSLGAEMVWDHTLGYFLYRGLIFDRIKAKAYADGKKRIIYLGDGKGDYCPSLKLEQSDRLMPRKDYPLWELITSDPSLIKAEIHEWSNGKEQEQILLRLINTIIYEDTIINTAGVTLLAGDCKFQTIPVSNHESFAKILAVPIKN